MALKKERLNPTDRDLRQQADKLGIYDWDTGVSRCPQTVIVKGEGYRCSLVDDHNGWLHQSLEAEVLW